MIVFPNCKINLGLHILRKREDGFHDLETVFYPIPLQDAVEVIQHPQPITDVEFSSSGLIVEGNLSDNICVKAYHLLKKDFSQLPPIKMHLHKTIPTGAGLGGGSADGSFTLMLLNKKFNLGLDEKALIHYALQLGSDCPFFIRNMPCYATGRGEKLEAITVDLSAYKFVLVNPQIHVNTGWAFSQIKPSADRRSLKELISLPVEEWKTSLKNDFEEAVFAQHPQIKQCKETLYNGGAVYASMTGSGSTVFGIFLKDRALELNFSKDYFVKIL
ncbi:4-(cytidine 5'-diphospho)-2-C-methyl-D-erythritol kinase [Flavisolibacter ginsenosidimutans]|uniref:4-diphosphocytidyl-2-C-methyl-D-erythritol kinase n=1 Tax=Flavisolibacter ginsenosidimutans TaxID=661481 RepID=A0A5B8UJZ0_9BACT|nr:4-(cytidine 5'-diphospho)-2-C-methyl-D-erythritol kinase [Flavisolibacter ginsenosidimutans]QEC56360.1 4-(cytidine 5'-diphospho)-2-C-methyl-D-erythritol kinase [Flavisolibacter ginsenosidimutans]